ncbi:MAG: hypothetical protein LBH13_06515 [Cellulomonadaceae bacterium]|nr:hypothetical protein [Cellulomonadaceae bacterium]
MKIAEDFAQAVATVRAKDAERAAREPCEEHGLRPPCSACAGDHLVGWHRNLMVKPAACRRCKDRAQTQDLWSATNPPWTPYKE